jgi:hypothetical protein
VTKVQLILDKIKLLTRTLPDLQQFTYFCRSTTKTRFLKGDVSLKNAHQKDFGMYQKDLKQGRYETGKT